MTYKEIPVSVQQFMEKSRLFVVMTTHNGQQTLMLPLPILF